jgi:hypothetical protein
MGIDTDGGAAGVSTVTGTGRSENCLFEGQFIAQDIIRKVIHDNRMAAMNAVLEKKEWALGGQCRPKAPVLARVFGRHRFRDPVQPLVA